MTSFAVTEDRLSELVAPYGGIEALNRRRDLYDQASARLHHDRKDLMVQYPDHLVAVGPNGVLAAGLSIEALLAALHTAGQRDEAFVVDFLNTSPEVLIL